MLSLDNALNEEELAAFDRRVREGLGGDVSICRRTEAGRLIHGRAIRRLTFQLRR